MVDNMNEREGERDRVFACCSVASLPAILFRIAESQFRVSHNGEFKVTQFFFQWRSLCCARLRENGAKTEELKAIDCAEIISTLAVRELGVHSEIFFYTKSATYSKSSHLLKRLKIIKYTKWHNKQRAVIPSTICFYYKCYGSRITSRGKEERASFASQPTATISIVISNPPEFHRIARIISIARGIRGTSRPLYPSESGILLEPFDIENIVPCSDPRHIS